MHAFLRYESILEYSKAKPSEAKMFNARHVDLICRAKRGEKNYGVKNFVDLSYVTQN